LLEAPLAISGTVPIPEGVTSIDSEAFSGCNGLTAITIPASVTSIGREAFRSCTRLTYITIPASVTAIGTMAFDGWSSSQTINVQGKANQAAADRAWGKDWRRDCKAKISYSK